MDNIVTVVETVVHSNGNKTIYQKTIDTTQPKVRREGFQYLFNSFTLIKERVYAKN